ncbi:hypothetical protein [Methanocella sp. MCL-LM]|uniref:hypothetical protein n=1 Tax=Methanocella sp. MCL-LM TaxID=3412035 RepID=UPI003C796979
MAVKVLVDAARSAPGYAGMTVISGDRPLFAEHIEPDYAMRLRALYCRMPGPGPAGSEYLCAVAAGFTFYIYSAAGFLILLKLSGRFSPRPSLPVAEPYFDAPQEETALPSRDGVRREAEALLRQYDLL